MTSFHESMMEFRQQLERGTLQQAYAGLMAYVRDLRSHFMKTHPDYKPTGIYYGYMDMTYFALVPESLKARKLKIAIVFDYDTFRFEVWLSGANRKVQVDYAQRIREHGWDAYHLAESPGTMDSILDHVLVEVPDFRDLDALTADIQRGTLAFLHDVEQFLQECPE